MRYRRRRHEYTPDQEKASKALHQAEMWLNIISSSISEQLKRDAYCTDGIRSIIETVNTDLSAAADRLEVATKAHDEAFSRKKRLQRSRVSIVRPKVPAKHKKESV